MDRPRFFLHANFQVRGGDFFQSKQNIFQSNGELMNVHVPAIIMVFALAASCKGKHGKSTETQVARSALITSEHDGEWIRINDGSRYSLTNSKLFSKDLNLDTYGSSRFGVGSSLKPLMRIGSGASIYSF